jgi:hypothetical protein
MTMLSALTMRVAALGAAQTRDPLWSLDGPELFYRRYDDAMMAATITETNSILSPGVSHKLFDDIYSSAAGRVYDLDREGQRFLMVKTSTLTGADAPRLIWVQNFFVELKRLVPVD